MAALTPAAVRKQIEAGAPDPIYLLHGDDEIEKAALASQFADLVDEDLRPFNVERIHASDLQSGGRLAEGIALLSAAVRTLPMMAPRRVVTVLHAEALLTPRRESDAANRAMDDLESLLQDPQPHATLVLVATSVDKRGRMYRILLKQATIVECGAIADAADAERWVRTRVAAGGAIIDQAAARFLVQRAGIDVGRLRGEIDRLLLYTLGAPRITVEDARIVGGPAALLDDWAMANAIERGEAGGALKQLALMLDAGAPPEKILGQLAWLVRAKFPEIARSALGDAVDALFRTDLDLKRSAGDARVLLERLVVELCELRAGAPVRSGPRAAW